MAQGIDVTVAAVVERDGRFLFVEELAGGHAVLNQPAGHLEPAESLTAAVIRETLEETGHHFDPTAVVGVYLWRSDETGTAYLRVTFTGTVQPPSGPAQLDEGILAVHWLTRAQIVHRERTLRSPMVLRCLDDYLAGVRHPLSLLTHLEPALPQRATQAGH